MANTIEQRTLVGGGSDRNIYRSVSIVSDGTEESDLVIFDNSAFSEDTSKGSLMQVWAGGDAGTLRLSWDQTADSIAFIADADGGGHWDFREFGGIHNPNGTGATGDLLLDTTGMDSGDEVMLVFHVRQI